MNCKLSKHIQPWIDIVEKNVYATCEEQKLLIKYVKKCFEEEEIYVDEELCDKYLGLTSYFEIEKLYEWEEFLITLHLCTFYKESGLPRWSDLFLYIGRGAGKDLYIAFESFSLASYYNKIKKYDIDICANNDEQAKRPVLDITEALENPDNQQKLKRFFYWTKEAVMDKRTKSRIRGHTNNPKTKDGLRSGMVAFNEIHAYESYANIKVFTTGLGKVKHPRMLYAGSDGDVRGGLIDDLKSDAIEILNGELEDNGMLPFMCRLDSDDEVHNPECWCKANPSLPYKPSLQVETKKEYITWKRAPHTLTDFMTKRMNRPYGNKEILVTEWEKIERTNKKMPDLRGKSCTCGIDFARVSDMVSINLHFNLDGKKYELNHSWLCLKSKDLPRLKIPYREWARQGLITLVDEDEIPPELIINYINELKYKYNIVCLAMDNFRYTLYSSYLAGIGFSKENKNLYLVRPSDIMKIIPVIESDFNNDRFIWGENPVLRWATNNTKLVKVKSRAVGPGIAKEDVDIGNYTYAKIEGKSRKTDAFMALIAANVIDNKLINNQIDYNAVDFEIGTITF